MTDELDQERTIALTAEIMRPIRDHLAALPHGRVKVTRSIQFGSGSIFSLATTRAMPSH
jgi:hypothetical protein